ncbi:MAG TPA: hypothetical protein VKT78_19415 [Fimbriimonadaceae bacterium]|nr:hypothetical protein [Fimbriimonadaceae bacterium]
MTKRQAALLERVEGWLDSQSGASARDAARALHLPDQAAEAVVSLGVEAKRLVRIGPIVVTARAFRVLVDRLAEAVGDRPFQPRELRDALGVTRGWGEGFALALEAHGLLVREPGGWRLKQVE